MSEVAQPRGPRAHIVRQAHARAVELGIIDIIVALQAQLGQALLAVIVTKSPRTIKRWANKTVRVPQAIEQLLRDTFQVVELLSSAGSPEVARGWLMGMNPQLDDASPAEVLSTGRARDVIAAARVFISAS
ncbi:XRE family transcriptional regulator [Cryobacterium sp. Hh11]|uniref:XRE family transcriptional regulator n=1 Tax=Cryobacterium sp. Hh11 TaxID=2555868 RepID=UPI00106D1370|nr:XRE family transcriptional regulator [Cryobacterium sp. Hh11]TFD52359.1 XRE family transcriptional regulator [Cryobacterium sp. Hh11]